MHHGRKTQAFLKTGEARRLCLPFLPTHSPRLNRIQMA